MKKNIGTILITVMGLVLLLYTGGRTLRLIDSTLPNDAQAAGYLALIALDGGLICWPIVYLYGARGSWQRSISFLMILTSYIGVVVTMAADTFLQASKKGTTGQLISADTLASAIWFVTIVIALNVGAVVGMHITSPENMLSQAEEEAHSKVIRAKLKAISNEADALAADVAPTLGMDWRQTQRAQYLAQRTYNPNPQLPPNVSDNREITGVSGNINGGQKKKRNFPELGWFSLNSKSQPGPTQTAQIHTTNGHSPKIEQDGNEG